MSLWHKVKPVVVFVIVFGFLAVLLINPGYFDRIYATIYNNYSQYCSYCEVEGHGNRFCPTKASDEGAFGRWVIPDVGVNVACYMTTDKAQEITDAKDSAALIRRSNATLLADHNYQGFDAINKCVVGTVAYMYTGARVQKYVCTDVLEGYNAGTHLTDVQGNTVKFAGAGGYTNYTCHFFSDKITIVHFKSM